MTTLGKITSTWFSPETENNLGLTEKNNSYEDLLDMDEDDKKIFMKLFIEARQVGLNKI